MAIVNLKHEPDAVANGAVLIDRRTRWGNPFVVGRDGTREEVIARYRVELWRQIRAGEVALADLASLESRRLACHCHPRPCRRQCPARTGCDTDADGGDADAVADSAADAADDGADDDAVDGAEHGYDVA